MKHTSTYLFDMFLKFATIICTFFAPTFVLFAVVGMAILLDTIAGRWCAKHEAIKTNRPIREVVTSKKSREGAISKIVSYNLAVVTIFLIDVSVMNEVTMTYLPWQYVTTKLTVLFIIYLEFDSIDEKYYKVKGIRLSDKIKGFFRGFKSVIREIINLRDKTEKK